MTEISNPDWEDKVFNFCLQNIGDIFVEHNNTKNNNIINAGLLMV